MAKSFIKAILLPISLMQMAQQLGIVVLLRVLTTNIMELNPMICMD